MYYPKSQITTNLYANSGELQRKNTGEGYEGPYYLLSNGKKYVGAFPSNVSIELIPSTENEVEEDFDASRYSTITLNIESGDPDPTSLSTAKDVTTPNLDSNLIDNPFIMNTYVSLQSLNGNVPISRTIPISSPVRFTSKDKIKGYYTRYFAKKNNESIYIETNDETYKKFKNQDSKVAFESYQVFPLLWILKSTTKDFIEINKKTVKDFQNKNSWSGFYDYFNGNFGRPGSKTRLLYTEGGELLYPNRTTYIGYYHIMENGTIMDGRNHNDSKKIILIPLNSNFQIPELSPTNIFSQGTNISPSSGRGSLSGGGY